MNAKGMQMGSTMSMGSTGSTETESSLESSCSKDSASTSSSLSTSSCEPPSTVSFGSITATSTGTNKTNDTAATAATATPRNCATRTSPIACTDLSTAITQELQRRAQQVGEPRLFLFAKPIRRLDRITCLFMRITGRVTGIWIFISTDSPWRFFGFFSPSESLWREWRLSGAAIFLLFQLEFRSPFNAGIIL